MSENVNPQDAGTAALTPEERLGALLAAEDRPSRVASNESPTGQDDAPQGDDNNPPQDDADTAPAEDAAQSDEDQAQAEDASVVEIDLDGKTYRVPKEVQAAVMKDADYRRKTTEVAEYRRSVEQMEQTAQAMLKAAPAVKDAIGQLQAIDGQLAQYEKLDWASIRAQDPAQYNTLVADMQLLRHQRQQVEQSGMRALQEYRQAETQKREAELQAGNKYLASRIKGWGAELDSKLTAFALSRGIPEDTLRGMVRTPHLVEVLHDAYQFSQQKQARPQDKRSPPAPTVRPGARPAPGASQQTRQLRDQLRKSGDMRLAARLIKV